MIVLRSKNIAIANSVDMDFHSMYKWLRGVIAGGRKLGGRLTTRSRTLKWYTWSGSCMSLASITPTTVSSLLPGDDDVVLRYSGCTRKMTHHSSFCQLFWTQIFHGDLKNMGSKVARLHFGQFSYRKLSERMELLATENDAVSNQVSLVNIPTTCISKVMCIQIAL